jgi:CCR4-NOT transcription complex subunit 1
MRLPDPTAPSLKISQLPEAQQPPRIFTDYAAPIASIRNHLDSYMLTQEPAELPGKLHTILVSSNGAYNVPLVTALVVYVGSVGIQQAQQTKAPLTQSPALEMFKQLALSLDAEGRYIVFNTMANQLRYPNSHTHFFSLALLHLFEDIDSEAMQVRFNFLIFNF